MAIPTTGNISFLDIQNEFGGSAPISMNEYYPGAGLVPTGEQGRPNGVRGNIPTSGAIDVNIFRGSVKVSSLSTSYDGNSIGGTGPTSNLAYNYAVDGRGINSLHLIAWGGGGAGAQWPSGAPGGYGGACYRISFIRGQSDAIDNLLDSITNINGNVGDEGSYQNGRLPDASRSGGPGGSSTIFINNSATLLVLAKGGHGSRGTWTNNDTSYVYPTNSGVVGEDIVAPGSNATYAGGGGGSGAGAGGSSVYGGAGGVPGATPGGGGSGIDNAGDTRVVGGQGRVRIIINGSTPF